MAVIASVSEGRSWCPGLEIQRGLADSSALGQSRSPLALDTLQPVGDSVDPNAVPAARRVPSRIDYGVTEGCGTVRAWSHIGVRSPAPGVRAGAQPGGPKM